MRLALLSSLIILLGAGSGCGAGTAYVPPDGFSSDAISSSDSEGLVDVSTRRCEGVGSGGVRVALGVASPLVQLDPDLWLTANCVTANGHELTLAVQNPTPSATTTLLTFAGLPPGEYVIRGSSFVASGIESPRVTVRNGSTTLIPLTIPFGDRPVATSELRLGPWVPPVVDAGTFETGLPDAALFDVLSTDIGLFDAVADTTLQDSGQTDILAPETSTNPPDRYYESPVLVPSGPDVLATMRTELRQVSPSVFSVTITINGERCTNCGALELHTGEVRVSRGGQPTGMVATTFSRPSVTYGVSSTTEVMYLPGTLDDTQGQFSVAVFGAFTLPDALP